jgi:uncharacterized protein (TIGR00661 family)
VSKKPVLIYSLASAGMGHVTRAVPVLERMKDEYEIHIFCSGQANGWIGKLFPHVHQNHAIKGATAGGKISLPLVIARAVMELPKSFFYIFRIAAFILIHRPKALITDFEAHSMYAALLVRRFYRVPIISCDHWTNLRISARPFALSPEDEKDLLKWQKTIKIVSGQADRYLVHGTLKTQLSDPRAKYVPTPVRDSFIKAGDKVFSDGPIVVSMGHLAPPDLSSILGRSKQQFVIYGSKNPRQDGNILYKAFNEEQFIESLRHSPFVIVAANSSAIDALAVKKPLLYCPTKGQFEQKFCGKMFEYLGVAKLLEDLTAEEIDSFASKMNVYQGNIDKLDIFDNDALVVEIRQAIKELGRSSD